MAKGARKPSDKDKLYFAALLGLALACVFMVVHEIYGEHGYLALQQERNTHETLNQQIKSLEQQNQELQKQIEQLKSDPKAIERVAREQMHLKRPGEIVLTLPEPDVKAQNPRTKTSPP